MDESRSAGDSLEARMAGYCAMLQSRGAIHSEAVAHAFATVRRDRCVAEFYARGGLVTVPQDTVPSPDVLDLVYSDRALVTFVHGDVSSSSQPSLVATMLEALDLSPGMRVLEVGAGTGYNAALIAVITGGPVVTVDSSGNIAAKARQALSRLGMEQQVTVVHGDGYGGHSTAAPYDRIVVTCGCVGFSPYWLEQLAENGLVLAPVAHGGWHPVVAIADPTRARMMIWSDFMPASGPLSDRRLPMLDTISSNVEFTPHTHVGPALDWDGYMSLWCFLGARDPRTTRVNTEFHGIDAAKGMCALNDPRRGIAWIQMDGTIHVTGDAALLDEVMRLVEEWETLGRPSVQDWTCTLSRSGAVLAPARWSLG